MERKERRGSEIITFFFTSFIILMKHYYRFFIFLGKRIEILKLTIGPIGQVELSCNLDFFKSS